MSNEYPGNERKENSPQKRRYVSPVLVRYGQVRDLTQSGSGSQQEAKLPSWLGGGCGPLKTRRSCASDLGLKENIVRIGEHPLGIGLYLFDYKPAIRDQWGHGRQFGVMAQEVETVMPEAVSAHPDGYKLVDYEMLGISRGVHLREPASGA